MDMDLCVIEKALKVIIVVLQVIEKAPFVIGKALQVIENILWVSLHLIFTGQTETELHGQTKRSTHFYSQWRRTQ
jgi:hypothetical protein